jgi:hypothetical protein
MSFKRKLVYISLLLFSIYFGYELFRNWILIQPATNFEHHREYGAFNIYSNQPIDEETKKIFDEVSFRLVDILDFNEGSYKVFLCSNPDTYGRFAQKAGKPQKTQGFNLQPLNHVFINMPFINKIKAQNSEGHRYSILEGNPAHILAHEICHQLIAKEIGFFRMRQKETWKLEGFCEYAASKRLREKDPSYSFAAFAEAYFSGRYDHIAPGRQFYIRSRLFTEYYLDHEDRSFEELMATSLTEDELLEELKRQNDW